MSFLSIETDLILLGIFAMLAMGLVKGATGVGSPLVAMPLLTLGMDVKRAIVLLTVPIILTNLRQALAKTPVSLEDVTRLGPVVLFFAPGAIIGSWLIAVCDPARAVAVAGSALLAFLMAQVILAEPIRQVTTLAPMRAGATLGFLNGVLGGVSGVTGPLAFMYILAFNPSPDAFTKLASIFLIFASIILIGALSQLAAISRDDLMMSLLLTAPAVLGLAIGEIIRKRIKPPLFRTIILSLIGVASIQMIYRGYTDIQRQVELAHWSEY